MADATKTGPLARPLRCGVVVRVEELVCLVRAGGGLVSVGYATSFPSPRVDRVSPGHLVALATSPAGGEVVVWRWYDAVLVAEEEDLVRLWEPAHGEVLARPRSGQHPREPGTRAYLSAGLPGADWWLAGPVVTRADEADVELDQVDRFCAERGVWSRLEDS